jgi:hypothetical protein
MQPEGVATIPFMVFALLSWYLVTDVSGHRSHLEGSSNRKRLFLDCLALKMG